MNRALRALTWLMLAKLFTRSLDYVTGTQAAIPDDGLQSSEVWGLAGLVASVIVFFGLMASKNLAVKLGAILTFAIYTMIGVQMFELSMLPIPWPPEDPRLSLNFIFDGAMWLAIAVIVWWREGIERECEREDRIE